MKPVSDNKQTRETHGGTGRERASALGWNAAADPIQISDIHVLTRGDPVANVALLEGAGFQPYGRTDLPRFPLTAEFDWSLDPFQDRNWLFQVQALRMIDPYLAAYADTRKSEYLMSSLAWMVRWCDRHVGRDDVSDFAWYDAAVGLRAMKLACLLDLSLRREAPADERKIDTLLGAWEPHVTALLDPANLAENNHAFFQLHGLSALVRLLPQHDYADEAKQFVAGQMPRLLRAQFTAGGVHLEHSPSYHVFACQLLDEYFASGWYDDIVPAQKIAARANAVALWLSLPDGQQVMVGDSAGRAEVDMTRYPDPNAEALFALDNGYAIASSAPHVASTSAYQLFFMGAHASKVHKHADDLSFVWYDRGQLLLTDSGKYEYESSPWREYVTSTRAHNTVEIDEESHGVGGRHAYGSAIESVDRIPGDSGCIRMVGRVRHLRFAAEHKRTLLLSPRKWLVVIDELNSSREHTYTQWFHFDAACELRQDGDTFGTTLREGATLRLHTTAPAADVESMLIRGAEEPRIQGWVSTRYREVKPSSAVGFTTKGAHAVLVAAMIISDDGASRCDSFRTPGGHVTQLAAGSAEVEISYTDGRADVLRRGA